MNSNGTHAEFTYRERAGGGFERTAWLTECKADISVPPIQKTTDSKWKVREPSGRVSPNEFTSLTYLGSNGTVYKSQVHCEKRMGLDSIATHFEETSEDGKQHKNNIKSIEIVDWDNSVWRVEILDVDGSHGQPYFKLTKLR